MATNMIISGSLFTAFNVVYHVYGTAPLKTDRFTLSIEAR